MATNTSNLNLSKPAYTAPADIAVINENMDKLDGAVNGVEDGLAIVANGNTHAAVAAGQFVYVRNHSSLAQGVYKATTAIAANGALSTSNLTADASGGLNALKADIDTLNSNLSNVNNALSGAEVINNQSDKDLNHYITTKAWRIGNISQLTNGPVWTLAGATGDLYVRANSTYISQLFIGNAGIASRLSTDGGSTWNDWAGYALKSDIETLETDITSQLSPTSAVSELIAKKIKSIVFITFRVTGPLGDYVITNAPHPQYPQTGSSDVFVDTLGKIGLNKEKNNEKVMLWYIAG